MHTVRSTLEIQTGNPKSTKTQAAQTATPCLARPSQHTMAPGLGGGYHGSIKHQSGPLISPVLREFPMDMLWFLLIGIAAGWLAGQIMKGGGFGLVGDLIVGVIGALLGGFLFGLFGLSAVGRLGSLVTATVGAIALIALLRVINRPRL